MDKLETVPNSTQQYPTLDYRRVGANWMAKMWPDFDNTNTETVIYYTSSYENLLVKIAFETCVIFLNIIDPFYLHFLL